MSSSQHGAFLAGLRPAGQAGNTVRSTVPALAMTAPGDTSMASSREVENPMERRPSAGVAVRLAGMSLNVGDEMMRLFGVLRHEPTDKWVRARLGDRIVVDSRAALLLWEPRRIVPTYAVPDKDVRAELVPVEPAPDSDVPVRHPGIPFAVHSTPGQTYDVRVGDDVRERAAFRPDDADLTGQPPVDLGEVEQICHGGNRLA